MTERTSKGDTATRLILEIFRVNGLLLAAGDGLGEIAGLTSARWQVLGAIAIAEHPLTVPQIARRMGLARQSVHVTVNRLIDGGLIELAPNQDHRRSQLVRLTPQGNQAYAKMDALQVTWVNGVTRRLATSRLESTLRVLQELCTALEVDAGVGGSPDRNGTRLERVATQP